MLWKVHSIFNTLNFQDVKNRMESRPTKISHESAYPYRPFLSEAVVRRVRFLGCFCDFAQESVL